MLAHDSGHILSKVSDASNPSKQELLKLLDTAREALQESQRHWGAVVALTGDRRYQRQQQEALELLDAMRRRVEMFSSERE